MALALDDAAGWYVVTGCTGGMDMAAGGSVVRIGGKGAEVGLDHVDTVGGGAIAGLGRVMGGLDTGCGAT